MECDAPMRESYKSECLKEPQARIDAQNACLAKVKTLDDFKACAALR